MTACVAACLATCMAASRAACTATCRVACVAVGLAAYMADCRVVCLAACAAAYMATVATSTAFAAGVVICCIWGDHPPAPKAFALDCYWLLVSGATGSMGEQGGA